MGVTIPRTDAAAPSQQRGWGRQQLEAPASPVRAPDSIPGLMRRNSPDNDPYARDSYAGSVASPSQLAPGHIRPPLANDISFKPRRRRSTLYTITISITTPSDAKWLGERPVPPQYGVDSSHSRPLLQYNQSTIQRSNHPNKNSPIIHSTHGLRVMTGMVHTNKCAQTDTATGTPPESPSYVQTGEIL